MSSAPFFGGTSPNDDRSPSPVNPPRYLHDFLADWPRMSVPTHASNWRRPPPHRFGPFRGKTDGPNWAATRRNTPNPVRISSPHTSERFIHSCSAARRAYRRLPGSASATRYPAQLRHTDCTHDCSQPLHQRCHQEAGGRCGVNGQNARSGQTPRRCRSQRRCKSSQDCDSATQKAHPATDGEMEGRAEGEAQGVVHPRDRLGSGHTQRNREEVHACRKPTHAAPAQRRKYPSLIAWQSTRRTFSLDT